MFQALLRKYHRKRKMKQPRIVIEVRPRLQSCQVYFRVDDSANSELFSLDVQNSLLTFKCNLWEETFAFENIKLKPVLINGLQTDDENIITCRLQTFISIDGSECKISSPKYVPNVRSGTAAQITCRFCHSQLLSKETHFSRILPLPSSDLSVGDFFCHVHSDEESEGHISIEPKLGDLLYGNYFFKINNELFCKSKLFSVKDVVYCQQCRTWIGTKENVSLKLWNCTVAFDSQTDHVSPKEDFISMITNLIDDWSENMCKIIVTHKVTSLGSAEYLLMWVMDRNLTLLVSADGSDKLLQKTAVKLLFSLEKSDSLIVPQWQKDGNTHSLDVAEVMFTEGLNCLEETNVLFPKMFRTANNMKVGYLFETC